MKKLRLYALVFSGFIFACLVSCSTSMMARAELALTPVADPEPSVPEKNKPVFNQRVEFSIPLSLAEGQGALNAEIYRPTKKADPMTLVILVPGAGNISRRGEQNGDGINNYENSVELYSLWAQALANKGFFALSYDKRSCNKSANTLCLDNPHKDIDEQGISAFASDLDQIYNFVMERLANRREALRVILMSNTQGAQVIALAQCAKKVNGIVLLSPIAGSLESMWVDGLMKAQAPLGPSTKRTRLLNQAESTKAFFSSLNKGQFPNNASVRGASITFWKSWMDASQNTLRLLLATKRPSLMLLSEKDVFSPAALITQQSKTADAKRFFTVKNISNADRNFIKNNNLASEAVDEVLTFIAAQNPVVPPKPAE